MTVHRLVQAVARARAVAKGIAPAAVARLIDALAPYYPHDVYENSLYWRLCVVLTPHVLAVHGTKRDHGEYSSNWVELLHRAGCYFLRRAAYAQGEPLFREALAICQSALGPEHPDTVSILNDLGLLLQQQGDFSESRPICQTRAGDL